MVSRTAPGRHQTLRATLDWSYQLLSEPERTLFRRLAVFNGGWTLAAAENVASGADIQTAHVLGFLELLLDKSLLVVENRNSEQVRFRFLETIRQYALERLSDSGELDRLRQRHLSWCLDLAKDVQPPGMHHPWHAHDTLQKQDNLRAALLWATERGDAEAGLRVAVALAHIWYLQGHYSEGRSRLAELLALPSDTIAPEVRASALTWAGHLAYCQGDLKTAQDMLENSLAIWRELGNDERTAVCLHQLANVVGFRGDLDAARPLLEQASAINHRLGHRMPEAMESCPRSSSLVRVRRFRGRGGTQQPELCVFAGGRPGLGHSTDSMHARTPGGRPRRPPGRAQTLRGQRRPWPAAWHQSWRRVVAVFPGATRAGPR